MGVSGSDQREEMMKEKKTRAYTLTRQNDGDGLEEKEAR